MHARASARYVCTRTAHARSNLQACRIPVSRAGRPAGNIGRLLDLYKLHSAAVGLIRYPRSRCKVQSEADLREMEPSKLLLLSILAAIVDKGKAIYLAGVTGTVGNQHVFCAERLINRYMMSFIQTFRHH